MLKVVDSWTTQHGSWDVKASNRWGIDQAHRDKYLAGRDIPGAGGDHHIFVNVSPGTQVEFDNEYNAPTEALTVPSSGWVNFPMSKDASYDPDKGEHGPWQIWINGVGLASGIGLPKYEHVSWFYVIEDVAQQLPTDTGEPPTSTPTEDSIRIAVNLSGLTYAGTLYRVQG